MHYPLPTPTSQMVPRRGLRSLLALAVVAGCMGTDPATAEEPAQLRSYLILGLSNNGKLDPRLREVVTQLIGREYGIARAPELREADDELGCRQKDCLRKLAVSIGWPSYILAGVIERLPPVAGGTGGTRITVAVYDVVQGITWQEEGTNPQSLCDSKDQDQKPCWAELERVTRLAMHAPPSTPDAGPGYLTFGRGLAQGVFSGFAVSGLVAGAAVTYANQKTWMVKNAQGQVLQVAPQLAGYANAGFGVMGVGLTGSLGSGVWGLWNRRSTSRRSSREERLSYVKGLLIGSTSSLLLSSLLAASALQAKEGGNCVESRSDISCTYYPGPAGLGWGMMGVWTAGLALSIGLSAGLK